MGTCGGKLHERKRRGRIMKIGKTLDDKRTGKQWMKALESKGRGHEPSKGQLKVK